MNWKKIKKASKGKLLLGTLIVSTLFLFVIIYIFAVLPTNSSPLPVVESIKLLPVAANIEPEPESVSFGTPKRLEIPKINVQADIIPVGLTAEGAMDVPKDQNEVAWFELGPRPGEIGSAVLTGHYGSKKGKGSIFDNLHKLRPGDRIFVEDENGLRTSYIVRESKRFNPNDSALEVFSSDDNQEHLNLITCEGAWNNNLQTFSKRLVVFTELEKNLE